MRVLQEFQNRSFLMKKKNLIFRTISLLKSIESHASSRFNIKCEKNLKSNHFFSVQLLLSFKIQFLLSLCARFSFLSRTKQFFFSSYEENKRTRKRTSKTKKLNEISVKRMRRTQNENVNKISISINHDSISINQNKNVLTKHSNILFNYDTRILIEIDMKNELKFIDKFSDESRLRIIYDRQNQDSIVRSLSSSKNLLSRSIQFDLDLDMKKKIYNFMKSTTQFITWMLNKIKFEKKKKSKNLLWFMTRWWNYWIIVTWIMNCNESN